ncbi:MAG: hypothetical protein ACO3UM_06085, partial [Planctomycetota bacterium]
MNRPAPILAVLALAGLIAYLVFGGSGGAAPLAPVDGPTPAVVAEGPDARDASRAVGPTPGPAG